MQRRVMQEVCWKLCLLVAEGVHSVIINSMGAANCEGTVTTKAEVKKPKLSPKALTLFKALKGAMQTKYNKYKFVLF